MEEVFGAEPVAPVEPPFEESESLPGPWESAGDVEEMIRAETDEPSLVGPDDVNEDESVAQPEVTSEEEEDAGLPEAQTAADVMEADLYPEVLGGGATRTWCRR